jgi:NADH-quinone oxidoreductase subunit N
MTILISSVWTEREDVPVGEYHCLLLFATVGMMFMASGNDLVVIFLGLETSSIATYVMAGLRKNRFTLERIGDEVFYLGLVRLGVSALRNGVNLRRDRFNQYHGNRR